MAAETITHHASTLSSSLTGALEEGIACFRGIPYATLQKRWTHSQVQNSLPSPFDATNYGPRCPQGEGQVLVTGGVTDPIPGDDEFKCLSLNVAVPEQALATKIGQGDGEGLPVMVWIHGGAFNYGANSVSRYRPVALSLLAKSQGHPIILVQIQYRLGPLGFAAPPSPPPTESALSSRLSNFGLLDQIHALEWIRDHISSFGGNPQNVTAFGVSAGSASIHHHILTSNPLFDRAILMSGSGPTLGPLPTSLYQLAWEKYISSSPKLQELTTDEERLEHARNTDVNELIANYTHAAMSPMADGILLPKEWDYRAVQKETRCKEIIIGDTHIEAIIMDGLISKIPQSKFLSIVKSTIPDASGFLRAFGFSIPTEQEGENAKEMEYTAYRDAMRTFLSVGMFQYPNVLVANKYPGKVYFYHFDEPSPYPGPTFGLAYHGQCALFVYQNGNETYPEGARNTAERMGRIWTGFASGKGPIKGLDDWEEYGVAKRFLRFGPNGGAGMQSLESDEVRQYKWLNWVEGKGNFDSVIELVRKLTLLGP